MFTKNQNNLSILDGYEISFDAIPLHDKTSKDVYEDLA